MRGPARRRPAMPAVEVADRDLVPVVPGVHRANHADVVDDPGRVGQKLRDLGAALAVLGELPRGAEELLARAVDKAERDLAVVLGAAAFRLSSGLGSSKSTCDGPPCMNSEIIAFALGAKCGARRLRFRGRFSPGFFGVSASSPSCCSKCARAIAPTPKAVFARKARRVEQRRSIDIEELVGNEQLLTEVGRARQVRGLPRPRMRPAPGVARQRRRVPSSALAE